MTEDDLDDMAALLGDPGVMRHCSRPRTREEALAWIDWNRRLYRQEGYGLWLVTFRATGEFVGDCGLTPQEIEGVAEPEVGYRVRAKGRFVPFSDEDESTASKVARNPPLSLRSGE